MPILEEIQLSFVAIAATACFGEPCKEFFTVRILLAVQHMGLCFDLLGSMDRGMRRLLGVIVNALQVVAGCARISCVELSWFLTVFESVARRM